MHRKNKCTHPLYVHVLMHFAGIFLRVKFKVCGRREGDVATVYANPDVAAAELGWRASRGLDEMCTPGIDICFV